MDDRSLPPASRPGMNRSASTTPVAPYQPAAADALVERSTLRAVVSPRGTSAGNGPAQPLRLVPPRRRWRLLTTRGRLGVETCTLCGALIVAEGRDRHEQSHRAERPDWNRTPS